MTDLVFVDTNVLVYVFDDDEPDKRDRARTMLDDAQPGQLMVSTQVLQEFYNASTRSLATPLEPATAEQATRRYAQLPTVEHDRPLVLRGIATSRRRQVSLWDALIIEAAKAAGCDRLWTEDLTDGESYDAVTVTDPFGDL